MDPLSDFLKLAVAVIALARELAKVMSDKSESHKDEKSH